MKVIGSTQENTAVYFLQQLWDKKNNNFVLPHNGRLTFTGTCTLWSAIDRTIKYAVSKYNAKVDQAKSSHMQTSKRHDRSHSPDHKRRSRSSSSKRDDRRFRRLPSPPDNPQTQTGINP